MEGSFLNVVNILQIYCKFGNMEEQQAKRNEEQYMFNVL